MRPGLLCWAAICLLSAGLVWAQQDLKNPFAGDPKEADAGRGLFRIRCRACHGIEGRGGRGPDLTTGTYTMGSGDAALYNLVANGRPGTEMPGFSALAPEADLWRLVTYLQSIPPKNVPPLQGDRLRGEQLFWGKGFCHQCHRVGARGGRLGPDLTRTGRQRSLDYLRAAIVDPGAEFTPGFTLITVVTGEGKEITGVERGFDNFSVQLLDAAENLHSFQRTQVRSVTREFRSLMPEYGMMLSDSEVDDLLAYLVSLRGEETR